VDGAHPYGGRYPPAEDQRANSRYPPRSLHGYLYGQQYYPTSTGRPATAAAAHDHGYSAQFIGTQRPRAA